jgi:hypothetical protein
VGQVEHVCSAARRSETRQAMPGSTWSTQRERRVAHLSLSSWREDGLERFVHVTACIPHIRLDFSKP